jgi:hypothetical protein
MIHIHDMLEKDYSGYGILVDLENVKKRYMVNSEGKRDGMLRTNIEAPDGWMGGRVPVRGRPSRHPGEDPRRPQGRVVNQRREHDE